MATDWRWIFLPWTYLLVSCRLACLSNYLTLSLCVCLEGLCHLRTRLLSKIVSVSPSHSLLLSSTNSLLIDYWLLPTYHCCWQRQCIFSLFPLWSASFLALCLVFVRLMYTYRLDAAFRRHTVAVTASETTCKKSYLLVMTMSMPMKGAHYQLQLVIMRLSYW